METTKNRLEYIAIARGIGIFLVVLGHTVVPEMRSNNHGMSMLFGWIYAFHMPLYAMLSGYLFQLGWEKYRKGGFPRIAGLKFRALMLPYYSISILSYLLIALFSRVPVLAGILKSGGYDRPVFLQSIWQILLGQDHIDKHIWFLFALFLIFILSYPLGRVFLHPLGILASAGLYLLQYFFTLPMIVYQVFSLLFFFNISRQTALMNRFSSPGYFLPTLLVFLTSGSVRVSGLAVDNNLVDSLIALLCGLSGSLLVFSLSRLLEKVRAARLLRKLSDESFVIYLFHQPFLVSGVTGVLLSLTKLPYLLICTFTLCLGIALPVVLNRFIIGKSGILKLLFLGKSLQKKQ